MSKRIGIIVLGSLVLIITCVGIVLSYIESFNDYKVMSITIALVGITTLFGVLALPGSTDSQGRFSESRIRLAIALCLITIWIAVFAGLIFFLDRVSDRENKFFESLTTFITIVLPFYFGASVASDYIKMRNKKSGEGENNSE